MPMEPKTEAIIFAFVLLMIVIIFFITALYMDFAK